MSALRVYCYSCGGSWYVYDWEDWNSSRCRSCPHCESTIDRQTWEKQILPAFGAMMDGNRELKKDYTGYNTPLFSVDYINKKRRKARRHES